MITSSAIIRDTSKLNSLVKSIKERGAKLDLDIHTAACSVIAHLAQHRDKTMVTRLWAAMPKSTRRKALCDWFEKLAPIKVSYDTGSVELPKADDETWMEFAAEIETVTDDACATPFWDLKPEKGAKDAVSLEAVLKYVTRKANSKDCPADQSALILALAKFGESLITGAQGELPLGKTNTTPAQPSVH
jgi:hypothetical protein